MERILRAFWFTRRARRLEYWLIAPAATLGVVGPVILQALLPAEIQITPSIFLFITLSAAWLNLTVGARRLHDRGKSAWWLLVFYGAPVVLPWIAMNLPGGGLRDEVGSAASVVSLCAMVWGVVDLGVLRGQPSANRFGPDPGASKTAHVFD